MKEKIKKEKISKEDFAEFLYQTLSRFPKYDKELIKRIGVNLHFTVPKNENFDKTIDRILTGENRAMKELTFFYTWIIVLACENSFEDEDKRNKCLDIFHHLVYKRVCKDKKITFKEWIGSALRKYKDYQKSLEIRDEPTPLWTLVSLINKNLFGGSKRDVKFMFFVVSSMRSKVEVLTKTIKELIII